MDHVCERGFECKKKRQKLGQWKGKKKKKERKQLVNVTQTQKSTKRKRMTKRQKKRENGGGNKKKRTGTNRTTAWGVPQVKRGQRTTWIAKIWRGRQGKRKRNRTSPWGKTEATEKKEATLITRESFGASNVRASQGKKIKKESKVRFMNDTKGPPRPE